MYEVYVYLRAMLFNNKKELGAHTGRAYLINCCSLINIPSH